VSDASLQREARLLTRYLLDRDCPQALAERYVSGHHARLQHLARAESTGLLKFAFAHPWSISYLDAAGGIVSGAEGLRAKVLLMAAVLEATPEFVDAFLPRHAGRVRTIWLVGWLGLRAVVRLLVGVPLVMAVRGSDR